MHGQSGHGVVSTGQYTSHVGLEADEKLDISLERRSRGREVALSWKKQRKRGCSVKDEADGESNWVSTGCSVANQDTKPSSRRSPVEFHLEGHIRRVEFGARV